MNKLILLANVLSSVMLVACGGGSDSEPDTVESGSPDSNTELAVARFTALGPVQGLAYSTQSQTGFTDERGQFSYRSGELVTFALGDIELPTATTQAEMTALDVFGTNDPMRSPVVNFNRLLATLDSDGQSDNGLQISESAHLAATGMQLDFSSQRFDIDVVNLVANSGSVQTELVPVPATITAFLNALDANQAGASGCADDHPLVGNAGTFEMFNHGVSGTLTVVDNCTLDITNFTYDGQGPSVLFYTGQARDYTVGPLFYFPFQLNGRVFQNERLRLILPDSLSLDDFDSLSVWCFDVRVNFGDVFFGS